LTPETAGGMSGGIVYREHGHTLDGRSAGTAIFSPCESYRYVLTRSWGVGPRINWVCLNPSTATETEDDPTLRRAISFSKRWGAAGMTLTNVYAWRSTDLKALYLTDDPVGPRNDAYLTAMSLTSAFTVLACGADPGPDRRRPWAVYQRLKPVFQIGLTKEGLPRHPLYVKGDVMPRLMVTA
jgi:hypothetical protein